MRYYVYIVYHGFIPVYVGKGSGLRYLDHFDKGTGVIVSALMEEQAAFSYERVLIRMLGRKDLGLGPLLNATDGGDGVEFTDKIRAKMRAAWTPERRKAQGEWVKNNPKAIPQPIIFTPETRAKMRAVWTLEKRLEQAARITKYNLERKRNA